MWGGDHIALIVRLGYKTSQVGDWSGGEAREDRYPRRR